MRAESGPGARLRGGLAASVLIMDVTVDKPPTARLGEARVAGLEAAALDRGEA